MKIIITYAGPVTKTYVTVRNALRFMLRKRLLNKLPVPDSITSAGKLFRMSNYPDSEKEIDR
jgi:hypothetical protein